MGSVLRLVEWCIYGGWGGVSATVGRERFTREGRVYIGWSGRGPLF